MFDLEKAVAAWRHSFRLSRVFLPDDLDELESHLRDLVDDLQAQGLAPQEAFAAAVRRLGPRLGVEDEYRKVRWGRRKRRRMLDRTYTWEVSMWKNYATITLRGMRRHKGYAFINVAGLAVGLAAGLLIVLFVRDERSYDRFHANADRIYRVVAHGTNLATSALLAPTMEREFPEVERGVRISRRWPEVRVTHGDETFYEDDFFFTDSTFFDVFSFTLLQGDPKHALAPPFSVVLTRSMADKLFGTTNPIGQTVNLKGPWDAYDFTVTGVVEEPPPNSHFSFQFLASFSTRYLTEPSPEHIDDWDHIGDLTYILLDEADRLEELEAQTPAFYARHQKNRGRQVDTADQPYVFQPITDIHLHSRLDNELQAGGEVRFLYLFSAVAALILFIAGVNYTNLATARSAHRAREVGVRKAVGAGRAQLVRQFLGESLLMTTLALVLAIGLVGLTLPAFNRLTGKALSLATAGDAGFWLTVAGIGLGIGLLAGCYPAVFLSRFRPARVLKGLVGTGRSNAAFRNGLVLGQFVITIALVAGTLVIQRQLDYLQTRRLGLNPEQVLILSARDGLGRSLDPFKDQLLQHTRILNVTVSAPPPPTRSDQMMQLYPERPGTSDTLRVAYSLSVGMDFLETLDIPLVAGRDLRPEDLDLIRNGDVTPVLINETTAHDFGWGDPIGKEFACCMHPKPRVVGVVEDFHVQSLKEPVTPLVLMPTWWARALLIRVQADEVRETLAYIEDQWQTAAPGYPFDYTFMDAQFAQLYGAEERLASLFTAFSGLAVFIAALGLFGLAAFSAEQRRHELGIRKVLGASAVQLVVRLSKDLVRLVGLAVVVSAPLAYLAMDRWLADFAYRIDISWPIFLRAGLAALGVAVLSVSVQSIRAALANPVESLRHE